MIFLVRTVSFNYFPSIRSSGWIGFSMIDFCRLRTLGILNSMKIKEDNRNVMQQRKGSGFTQDEKCRSILINHDQTKEQTML